jgi:hypothetical protein
MSVDGSDRPSYLSTRLAHAAVSGALQRCYYHEAYRLTRQLTTVYPNPVALEPSISPWSLEGFLTAFSRPLLPPSIPPAPESPHASLKRQHLNINDGLRTCTDFANPLTELHAAGPICFELVGNSSGLAVAVLAPPDRLSAVGAVLQARTPVTLPSATADPLREMRAGDHMLICEATSTAAYHEALTCSGSFVGLVATAISSLRPDELGVYQAFWVGCQHPAWSDNVRSLFAAEERLAAFGRPGAARSEDRATHFARQKATGLLFMVVIRLAAQTSTPPRTTEVRRLFFSILRTIRHGGKPLCCLTERHFERALGPGGIFDMVRNRRVHRHGLLVNAEELATVVHPPEADTVLRHQFVRLNDAPSASAAGLLLGQEAGGGPVSLPLAHVTRGVICIGNTGTGKTALIRHLGVQIIQGGAAGLAVLDPHGDINLLEYIPPSMADRVVVLDPAVPYKVCRYNPLRLWPGENASRRAEGLAAALRHQASAWGDVMTMLATHGAYALLKTPHSCLADLKRLLSHSAEGKTLQRRVRQYVDNEECRHFFDSEFPAMSPASVRPLLTQLSRFLLNENTARLFYQRDTDINFRDIMDTGGIFIARLPVGILGVESTTLIGAFLLSQIHEAAMSRADAPPETRRLFFVFADEFHRFVSSGAEVEALLRETRKMNVATCLATQYLEGLHQRIVSAIENVGSIICFDVGETEASRMARSLRVPAKELMGNGVGVATVRLDGGARRVRTPLPPAPAHDGDLVMRHVLAKYYTDVAAPAALTKPEKEGLPYDDI